MPVPTSKAIQLSISHPTSVNETTETTPQSARHDPALQSAYEMSPSPHFTEKKSNRFAGNSFGKRPGSPVDGRSPKLARPVGGIVTRSGLYKELLELKSDVKRHMDEDRTSLFTHLATLQNQMRDNVDQLTDTMKRIKPRLIDPAATNLGFEEGIGHHGELMRVTQLQNGALGRLASTADLLKDMLDELIRMTRTQANILDKVIHSQRRNAPA